MRERPILFSAPMVRAILEGRKTQTRRTVKQVGKDGGFVILNYGTHDWPYRSDDGESASHTVRIGNKLYQNETPHDCPYGRPGDRLWVKETFRDARAVAAGRVLYRASGDTACGWRPSIFMPRELSRVTLEVTGIRVERLQDISEADAIAEGVDFDLSEYPFSGQPTRTPTLAYRQLWNGINGTDSWAANPWVWVVEFKRVQA